MIRLDERALREDALIRRLTARRGCTDDENRVLFDAIVDKLARYFMRAMKEPSNVCERAWRSHRSQRSQRPFLG